MSARAWLRAETGKDHERVDRLFSRFDLSSLHGYRRFLIAQADAFLPVEAAIDQAPDHIVADWPQRRRGERLRSDLRALGVEATPPAAPLPLETKPAVAAAIYVLEGSRLGGAVLRKSLPPGAPRQFLEAPQAPGSWRKLLEKLDEVLYQPDERAAAAVAAKAVFGRFEESARRQLEIDIR